MIERLTTEDQTSLIAAQFVPLKLDTGSEDWKTWARQYKYEGSTIPIVFVVRGDGEQIYGQSGSLPGEKLPIFLVEMLSGSGNIPSAKELEAIQTNLVELKAARESGDWKEIGKTLRKVKKLGPAGNLGSYATSASELDSLVNEIVNESKERIVKLEQQVDEDGISSAETETIIADFEMVKKEVGQISFLDKSIAKSLRSISRSKLVKDYVASKSKTENETDTTDSIARTWTSSNGKFSVEAILIEVEDGIVKLKKADGKIVEVALSKLSNEDREFVDNLDN